VAAPHAPTSAAAADEGCREAWGEGGGLREPLLIAGSDDEART